jgi:hypothetical protein
MNVYRLATAQGVRFIRAASVAHARVRLYKSQAIRAHSVDLFGNNAPQGYAIEGYDSAVKQGMSFAPTSQELRAAQKGNGARFDTFYKVSEKQKTSILNKARTTAIALGLV